MLVDILRGYVAQRLMWEEDLHLGFTRATVYQQRNAHDLMRDFRDEIECYRDVNAIVDLLDHLQFNGSPLENLTNAYTSLAHAGFVPREELRSVRAWVEDVKAIAQKGE